MDESTQICGITNILLGNSTNNIPAHQEMLSPNNTAVTNIWGQLKRKGMSQEDINLSHRIANLSLFNSLTQVLIFNTHSIITK
jgi:hypothetical protein